MLCLAQLERRAVCNQRATSAKTLSSKLQYFQVGEVEYLDLNEATCTIPAKCMSHNPQRWHNLLTRTAIFVLLFLVVSGITGSWLISKKSLLYPFYFSIYGGAGKVILFSLVSFFLLVKDNIFSLPVFKISRTQYAWLAAIPFFMIVFFYTTSQLLAYEKFSDVRVLSFISHGSLWAAGVSILLGVYGWQFLVQLKKTFFIQGVVSVVLALGIYFSFDFVFDLWPYLSKIVLWAVAALLQFTFESVTVIRPLTLYVQGFGVTIGEYCSGIESLFLISVLYILMGCIEWTKLRKIRYFLYFPPLLIGMFMLNILRVYGIILAGVWISPEIAAKLFHTYLGMVLFLGYFLVFLSWAYPKLIIPKKLTKSPEVKKTV